MAGKGVRGIAWLGMVHTQSQSQGADGRYSERIRGDAHECFEIIGVVPKTLCHAAARSETSLSKFFRTTGFRSPVTAMRKRPSTASPLASTS